MDILAFDKDQGSTSVGQHTRLTYV